MHILIEDIRQRYPMWNRTNGKDHFFVSVPARLRTAWLHAWHQTTSAACAADLRTCTLLALQWITEDRGGCPMALEGLNAIKVSCQPEPNMPASVQYWPARQRVTYNNVLLTRPASPVCASLLVQVVHFGMHSNEDRHSPTFPLLGHKGAGRCNALHPPTKLAVSSSSCTPNW